jgi:outer membrane receptor protein involved in Fe transport
LPSGQIDQSDILPALTAKVQLRDNVDLQAAWSQTIVRPTYREIAAVPIYDVTQVRTYIGNPNLIVSDSDNYDLRLSWYPRPGEIFSASVFAKTITAPIEQASVTIDNSIISYANFEQADLIGVEGEIRLGLDRLWEPLKPLTFGLNAAYIESEVPLTAQQMANRANYGDTSTVRPLYNQPEYIFNADLTWDIAATRTTVTLSGGIVGESLVLVGLASPDEYLQPAPELNLFIRQRIGKNWDVRFTAKNLLNPKQEIAQTWPNGEKLVLESYTKGVTFGLSVGCEF